MILVSHPTGNANVRAVACGLREAGILSQFNTSIASFEGSLLDNLGALGPFSEIRRRRFDTSLRKVTHTWPWVEAARIMASKTGLGYFTKHEDGLFCIDAVYRHLDKQVASSLSRSARRGIKAIYAYEDGASISFRQAKDLNIQCLYDLPIGYWRAAKRLLENERILKPEWASTMVGFQDSEAKLTRKDEELQLADRIFVASKFTASTLNEFPGKLAPVEVIPYGFPPVAEHRKYAAIGKRPLKLLFVGGLSQRKGIADLFAAVDAIGKQVELTVVGQKASYNCAALDAALAKHKWIPSLAHPEVLKLMKVHDVLVFPSLFEGFGLVITEAMSQGTPVITTDRTAGPDFIEHGQNGWLVEAGSSRALQASIENLINNPELIAKVGKAAMETARGRTWVKYGQELAEAILKYNNRPG